MEGWLQTHGWLGFFRRVAGEFPGTCKRAAVCSPSMAGPTIEWLEPKLPDLLKNGDGSLGSFPTDEGPLEENRLELNSTEFSSFSGVRAQKQPLQIPRVAVKMLCRNHSPLQISGYFATFICCWPIYHVTAIFLLGTGRHQCGGRGWGRFHGRGGGPGRCGGGAQRHLTPPVTAEAGHGPHTGGLSSTYGYSNTTPIPGEMF